MRAIVIDDSRAMRGILKGILRERGYEVVEAGNGREGLEQLRATSGIEVALVDWHMPEMDGCAFVKAVRADPVFRELPILMVTSESDGTRVALALLAGADEYVMKPFTRDTIIEKLALMGRAGRAA